jgi:hypothetical protein
MQAQTHIDGDLLILLYDVGRHMRTYSDHVAAKHGMTRAQWVILSRLERQPNIRSASSQRLPR